MELLAGDLLTPKKRKREENTITLKAKEYFRKIDEFNEDDKIWASNEASSSGDTPQKKKTHICKLCNSKINATKEWNLAMHLSRCHTHIYQKINESSREPLVVTRLKVLQNCTETVAVNGRPFEWIMDSGYRKQFQKTLDELSAANLTLNLSTPLTVVKEHLAKVANKVRELIQNEVKDRPLSLLVDLVTKHKRSILGVSVQYTFKGELKVRSIGFIELLDRHTGVYLSDMIIVRLGELGIKLMQIFSITTDNAKNVLKLVRDMSECLQADVIKSKQKSNNNAAVNPESLSDSNDEQTDSEINELLVHCAEVDDEEVEALERAMDEVPLDCHETLLEVMTQKIGNSGEIWHITGVKCAAHTLQLAINASITNLSNSTSNVISLCREVSKFLRLISTKTEMAQLGIEYRLPRLEVPTRWSSLYLMVIDFLIFIYVLNYYIAEFLLIAQFIVNIHHFI